MAHDVAREISRACQGQRIDVTLTAIAEALARAIVEVDCEPDAALEIVARFTHEWVARGGLRDGPAVVVRTPIVVRSGEPDRDEAGLEDDLDGAAWEPR